MTETIKLSVVIITYNEEKNMVRCIESVGKVADEIVVVDSFSTDKTKEICLSYGVKFIEHAFEGYVQQKNYANSQATYPHILSVDADEVLTDELIKSILAIKQNWEFDGYYLNRITNYCGKWIKHGGWYPDKLLRLWYAPKGQWMGINLHEHFEMKEGCRTSILKGDLRHYSYYSIEQHIAQVNKFTEIAAKTDFESGRRISRCKLIFYPIWKFKRDYIFRLGFLDGYYGFVIAVISAFAAFAKYAKIREKLTVKN
jgi:glycosyltransferase involved in cell wall biosynthesis